MFNCKGYMLCPICVLVGAISPLQMTEIGSESNWEDMGEQRHEERGRFLALQYSVQGEAGN